MAKANLEKLEAEFREAQEVFAEDKTDENHDEYQEAKRDFALARVEQRKAEEADSNSRRGQSLVFVDDNDGEGDK